MSSLVIPCSFAPGTWKTRNSAQQTLAGTLRSVTQVGGAVTYMGGEPRPSSCCYDDVFGGQSHLRERRGSVRAHQPSFISVLKQKGKSQTELQLRPQRSCPSHNPRWRQQLCDVTRRHRANDAHKRNRNVLPLTSFPARVRPLTVCWSSRLPLTFRYVTFLRNGTIKALWTKAPVHTSHSPVLELNPVTPVQRADMVLNRFRHRGPDEHNRGYTS